MCYDCSPENTSVLNETGQTGLNKTGQTGSNYCDEVDDEECYTPYFSPQADIVGIFLTFLIVVLNTMVFILVAKKRSLRTTTNNFLIGLAASDLLTGLISLPLYITCNIFREHGVCFSTIYVWMFTSFLTVSHILAVTADRFIAIMFALRYPQIVTKRRCYIALGFVWGSSLCVSLLQLGWLQPVDYDPLESVPEEHEITELTFSIVCFVVYLVVPVGFMAFTYLMTVREVRRQNRRQLLNVPADLQDQQQWRKREGKAITIFFVMFVTYVACWLPFFLLRYQQVYNAFYLPYWAEYMFGYARYTSSVLNPCMYIFGKHDFRKAWRALCTFKSTERDRARSDLVMIMSSQL